MKDTLPACANKLKKLLGAGNYQSGDSGKSRFIILTVEMTWAKTGNGQRARKEERDKKSLFLPHAH